MTSRIDRLCELNVVEQVRHVCQTTIVRDAWLRRQPLTVHGWIYDVHDGLLRDLGCTAASPEEQAAAYDRALASTALASPGGRTRLDAADRTTTQNG